MKKRFGICAITLVIAGLMISSVASQPAKLTTETSELIKPTDASVGYMDAAITKTVDLSSYKSMSAASSIIYDTEYDDFHPTLAGDASGRFFAAFELTLDGVDYYPDFWYSLDGTVWDEAGYFAESLGAMFPDVDSNDNGFYGTFGGNENNGAEEWLIIAEDLTNIGGLVWDWSSYGFDDFEHMSISCYTRDGELWNPGGIAGTGYNGYSGNDWDGNVFIFYPVSDTSGSIGWLIGLTDYLHADFAIDEVTEYSYAVYESTVEANLLVRKDNFGVWDSGGHHPYVGSWYVGDDVTQLLNPSIEANDDTVVVVAEEEGNIVCFYSDNGFTSVSQSTVADSAVSPEVKVTFDGETFACSFVKGGAVQRKISNDGGATWTDEQQVEDSQAVAEFGTHCLGKGAKGIFSVWEDTRGGDRDIYFGQALEVTAPELDIISIGGPIGVKATIKNIGDADATNVEWSMQVTGGILGLINKDVSGTEATLAIDGEIVANSGIIIGLGSIAIAVTAECDEGSSDSANANGFQFIIFSLVS